MPPDAPIAAPAASATTVVPTGAAPADAPASGGAAEDFHEISWEGSTEKVSLADLKKYASLGKSSGKRYEEGAKMRREAMQVREQAEGLLDNLRDPRKAIALLQDPRLGLDQDEVRTAFEDWYKTQYIDREAMSEEQRLLADAQARLKDYEEKDAKAAKDKEQQQNDEMDEQARQQLSKEIIDLIGKSGLPKTKFTSGRIAYWMRVNESKGLNAPAELIVEQVRKETREVTNSLVQGSDGEMLVNVLGEDTVRKLREFDLQRLRAKRGMGAPQKPALQPPKPQERIDMAEVKRRMREFR